MGAPRFHDRADAGHRLGRFLRRRSLDVDVVLGLPRGGVPVAAEVAAALHTPLDVIVVRKLGLPGDPEVAMGAVGEGGTRVFDDALAQRHAVTADAIAAVERRERDVVRHRVARLRPGRATLDLHHRSVLIVDDGVATGATASAACQVARAAGARWVGLAAPVVGPDAETRIRGADAVFALRRPGDFHAVGVAYEHFEQTTDDEVERLLQADRSAPELGGSL